MVTWLQGTNCMAEWHGGGKVLTAKKSRSRERRETGMKIQPSKSPWQWPSLYQLGFTRGIDVIWKYMCGKVFTKQAYNSHLWCQEWKNAKGPSCARELEELVEGLEPLQSLVWVHLGKLKGPEGAGSEYPKAMVKTRAPPMEQKWVFLLSLFTPSKVALPFALQLPSQSATHTQNCAPLIHQAFLFKLTWSVCHTPLLVKHETSNMRLWEHI